VSLPDPQEIVIDEESREETRREYEVSRLRTHVSDLQRSLKGIRRELELTDARLETLLDLQSFDKPIAIKPRKSSGANQSTAVLIASDWHVEEEVRPEQVGGLNRYDLDIAAARIDKFWRNGLTLINSVRGATKVHDLVLVLGGDFYSGHIHEDLVESTAFSPIHSVKWLIPKLRAGIDFMLEHGDFKKIYVVGKIGNHSRLTSKPRVSTAFDHSLEWLMYDVLAQGYKGESRVQFNLEPSYLTVLPVYDFKLRIHHGDYLRYAGGIGGLSVPLNKAIHQWNRGAGADLDILGHWHSWQSSIGRAVVNGSLIGYSPFAVKIKAEYEPPQQGFCLISEKYGRETLRAPVFVE
jgi:hypothetical protein